MKEILEALVLGIVQGLTEFLPVSSSGHLELAKWIMQDDSLAEDSMLMTVFLHAATALSTIVIFRKEIVEILTGLWQFIGNIFHYVGGRSLVVNDETWFSLKIVLSMIPAAIVGLLFEKEIEELFNKNILLVGFMLILTGLLLFLADRAKNSKKTVSFPAALIIGIAQAIAILPGISRSGATISTSVLLGIDRERAARFSFLMVVPLIFGKISKDILDGAFTAYTGGMTPLIVGFIAAFLTGLVACQWMIGLVKNSQLKYFSFYCFAVAIVSIAVYSLG
ncbi:MAG: undecaprenyl-diphosphatase [Saprospiraceae bacterium]|jgi:undecaprenyl-diphosphatase